MRLGVHAYATDPLLPQRDGVNFAHENFTRLLREAEDPGFEIEFHDFNALMADLDRARDALARVDCIFSNVGPHAQYYFWLREKLGLGFRILRDVRTAIWSSYLFQEHLIAPLLRPNDTLLVASNYVWGAYERMFPHLADYPSALCYPLSIAFPHPRPEPRAQWPMHDGTVTVGYLGRVSDDKNFPDIIELVIRLNRDADRLRYKLVACGEVHSASCGPERVAAQFAAALGEGDWYEYQPARPNERIWEMLDRFDVLVFPSTSNLETFGRVLIEASYARVPIVAGRHAASSELVDRKGLCSVEYETGRPFVTHFDHRLGRVDVAEMAAAIGSGTLQPSQNYERYADHPEVFLAILRDPAPAVGRPQLTRSQRAFIDALDLVLPPLEDKAKTVAQLDQLAGWFRDLQRCGTEEYTEKLAHLREISPYPERTERFIAKSEATNGDFTNVGGIDIELCHLLQFYPQFTIRGE